jgi:hypothetical protein
MTWRGVYVGDAASSLSLERGEGGRVNNVACSKSESASGACVSTPGPQLAEHEQQGDIAKRLCGYGDAASPC